MGSKLCGAVLETIVDKSLIDVDKLQRHWSFECGCIPISNNLMIINSL